MILTFLHIGDMHRGISRYVGQNVLGCGVMGSRSEGANDRLHPPPLMGAPESGHGRTLGSLTITRLQGTNCTAGKDMMSLRWDIQQCSQPPSVPGDEYILVLSPFLDCIMSRTTPFE